MKQNSWLIFVMVLACYVDKKFWKTFEYLKEQVRVLKEQREKDKRILLNSPRRIRLAAKAKGLTRDLLEATTVLFTPETVLGWYRKLIPPEVWRKRELRESRPANDLSGDRRSCVIRVKEEDPHYGYTRIRDYYAR